MKTITNRLTVKNALIIILMMMQGIMYGQKTSVEKTAGTIETDENIEINTSECSASDVSVTRLYLTDLDGNRITSSCEPGETRKALIFAEYDRRTNAERYSLFIYYRLLVNGNIVASNNNTSNTDVPSDEYYWDCKYYQEAIPFSTGFAIQEIDWTCGDKIELDDFYMAWQNTDNKECGPFPSKCFRALDLAVNGPLVSDFESSDNCDSQSIDFIDKTTGGNENYNYLWDFGDSNTSTAQNTSHEYSNPGTYKVTLKVTDTDDEPSIDYQEYDITVYSVMNGLTLSSTEVDCVGNNTGSITASGTVGGKSAYTYSISPDPNNVSPSNSNVFNNLPSGNFTVTVTDSRNCTISADTAIIVGDTTAPSITAPGEINVEGCTTANINNENKTALAFSPAATTISTQAFEAEGGNFNEQNVKSITYSDSASGSCPIVVTRTFVITDECDQTASATQTINIDDSTPPTFTVPGPKTISCDEDSSIANTGDVSNVQDNCGSIASSTHSDQIISGSCAGTYKIERTFTVLDACGNEYAQKQIITIEDTTPPAAPSNPDPANYQCLSEVPAPGQMSATDNCDNGTITVTGVDSINDADECKIIITRTWTFSDVCDNKSTTTQIITVEDTTAPDVPETIDPVTYQCIADVLDPVTKTAVDNCGDTITATVQDSKDDTESCNVTITRTWTFRDSCGNESTTTQNITVADTIAPVKPANPMTAKYQCMDDVPAPGQMTAVDNCVGNITVTGVDSENTSDNCNKIITRTWTFEDDCKNISTTTQIITVEDTKPPVQPANPMTASYQCMDDVPAPGQMTAVDNCAGDITVSGVDSESTSNDCNKIITRTWTFEDACKNVSTTTQTITIADNKAPEAVATIAAADYQCMADVPTNVERSAIDNCDGEIKAISVDSVNSLNPCNIIITRTWTFTDSCLNKSTTTQTINVKDNTPPVAPTAPVAASYDCLSDVPAPTSLTALDNCKGDITVMGIDSYNTTTGGSSNCNIEITRSWTFKDDCNNVKTITQTINVDDNVKPTIKTAAQSKVFECDSSGNQGSIQNWLDNNGGAVAEDNCGMVTWSNDYGELLDTDCKEPVTVTFRATDACNNFVETLATYTIDDSVKPSISLAAQSKTVECDGSGNMDDLKEFLETNGGAKANDDCSAIDWTHNFVALSDECGTTGSALITFRATDGCGNFSETSATFTIEDTTNPTISAPADIAISCDQNDQDLDITGSPSNAGDTCSESTNIEFVDEVTPGDCAGNYVIKRTFTITDDCGRTASDFQTITVEDNTPPTFDVPETVTIECDEDINDLSITGRPTNELDNCSSLLKTEFSDTAVDGTCPVVKIVTRTFTLIDECGNDATGRQTIIVQDTKAPEFDAPLSVTISCEEDNQDLSITGNPSNITDNCSSSITTEFSDEITPGNCAGNYTINRTFTLKDECNNVSEKVQVITVEDKTPPTFTLPIDVTIECDEDINDLSITGRPTNESDNCSSLLKTEFSDTSVDGTCPLLSIITRTFTITDECGNVATGTQTINVQDTQGPDFDAPESITISCEEDVQDLDVTGRPTNENDNCSDILKTEFVDVISQEGNCDGNYTITRTFTVTDECDNSISKDQIINVEDKKAPTFNVPNDVTIECDEDINNLSITGRPTNEVDNCSTLLKTEFSDEITEGVCPTLRIVTRTFTVTDECGNAASNTQTITVIDSTKPNIEVEASPIDVTCSADGNDTQILDWLASNGNAVATDNCTDDNDIIWTNNYGDVVPDCTTAIEVIFTATDSCGNFAETTATYRISDNEDPSIDVDAVDKTVECDGSGNAEDLALFLATQGGASASDTCSAVSWSNDYTSLSNDCGATGSALITFTATDACGNTEMTSATFKIEDTQGPDFDVPANITIACDADNQNLELTGNVTNEIDTCSSILNIEFEDEISAGSCAGNYVISRKFTVTDECNNATTKTQTITVEDKTGPTFTVPADTSIECNEDATDLSVTGNVTIEGDNCTLASAITVEFSDETVQGDCANERMITRTFTLTDECGNVSTDTQVISVEDNTPPSIDTPANSISLGCSDGEQGDLQNWLNTMGGAKASDNCSTESTIVWTNNYGGGATDCSNSVEVTFTATDECGNSNSTTATYSVQDVTPPSITTQASPASVECGDDITQALTTFLSTNGGAVATDDCSAVTWSNNYSELALSDLCGNTGDVEVTFTATDGCNNMATTKAIFTIQDTTPPVITTQAGDATAECDGVGNDQELQDYLASFGGVIANDTCGSVTLSSEIDSESSECGKTKIISVRFIAEDDCGNKAVSMGTFSIVDTTPPVIDVQAETVSIECGPGAQGQLQAWLAQNGNASVSDSCSDNLTWSMETNGMSTSCAGTGSMTVIYTATDDCGNTASTTATFQIVDTTAPTFTVPESTSIECDADATDLSLTGDVTNEADNCATDIEATYTDSIAEGGECPVISTITRTWTLMDDCGNSNTQTQIIEVIDSTAPTFTVPPSITLACADDVEDMNLAGDVTDESDNCSTDLIATFTDATTAGDCPNSLSLIRTWTLVDACGNTNTQTQSITVEDTEAPTLDGDLAEQISVACGEIPAVPSLVFVDNCSSTVDVQFNEESGNETDEEYLITREWTVMDECNNTAVFTQTITVSNTPVNVAAGDVERCIKDLAINLLDFLDTSAPTGGTFSLASGSSIGIDGTMLDPTLFDIGEYIVNYNVEGQAGDCPINYQISVSITECIVLPPPPVCPVSSDDIEISQAVTPNGDGINDVFTIGGFDAECGFVVELTIFNRWGAEIYQNNNYDDTWGAEASNASVGNSNLVPTGTYYYIINLKNSDFAPFAGPIYVGTK